MPLTATIFPRRTAWAAACNAWSPPKIASPAVFQNSSRGPHTGQARVEPDLQLALAHHLAGLLGASDDAFDVAASGYDYPPAHGHRRRRAKVDMIALFSVLRVHFIDERQQDARPRGDRYVGRRARRGPLRQHRLRRVATRLG